MSKEIFTSQFRALGVSVKDIDEKGDVLEVALTPVQFEKLSAAVEDTALVKIADGAVIAQVTKAALVEAVKAGVKAPRNRSQINVDIQTRTVYAINAPEAKNVITGAEWNSAESNGAIFVNEGSIDIRQGEAQDFYEVGPESDPSRPVFYVTFNAVVDGIETEEVMPSYGLTNLIRRLCAYNGEILV